MPTAEENYEAVYGNVTTPSYMVYQEEDEITLEELEKELNPQKEEKQEHEEVETKTEDDDDIQVPADDDSEKKPQESSEYNFDDEEDIPAKDDYGIEVPEKFNSKDDELKFYKEGFEKVKKMQVDPQYLVTKYEDSLLEKQKDVEELKALRDMLKGQPDAYVKIRFKDELVKGQYDHRLTTDEINDLVHKDLVSNFGSNYADLYSKEDAGTEGTLSYKMYQRQEAMLNKFNEFNEVPKGEEKPQMSKEEAVKMVTEKLSGAGINEKNINRFLKDVEEQKIGNLFSDPLFVYKAYHMDKIIAQKVKQAKKEGREEALKEIKKANSSY